MLSENRRPSVAQTRWKFSEEPENIENQHEPIDQGGIYIYTPMWQLSTGYWPAIGSSLTVLNTNASRMLLSCIFLQH